MKKLMILLMVTSLLLVGCGKNNESLQDSTLEEEKTLEQDSAPEEEKNVETNEGESVPPETEESELTTIKSKNYGSDEESVIFTLSKNDEDEMYLRIYCNIVEEWKAAYCYLYYGNIVTSEELKEAYNPVLIIICNDIFLSPGFSYRIGDETEVFDSTEWCTNAITNGGYEMDDVEQFDENLEKYLYDFFEIEDDEAVDNESQDEDIVIDKDYIYEEPYYAYSGNGDDVISGVETDNFSYAHIVHDREGYFSVKGYYEDTYDLLVSTTDPYDGNTVIRPQEEYTFEVSGEGDWSIEIYNIGLSSTDSFSGFGDYVSPMFTCTSNTYEITTSGEGYFSISGWTDYGRDLLVSTTDEDYSGKVLFRNEDGIAFFEIKGNREWEIKPVK